MPPDAPRSADDPPAPNAPTGRAVGTASDEADGTAAGEPETSPGVRLSARPSDILRTELQALAASLTPPDAPEA
jgi:hypothetical protein